MSHTNKAVYTCNYSYTRDSQDNECPQTYNTSIFPNALLPPFQGPVAQENLLGAGPQPVWKRLPFKPFEGVNHSPGAVGGEAQGVG